MKHLKCLGLFLAMCAGIAAFMAVASVVAIFIVSVIGPDIMVALLILGLLVCILGVTHEICKDWD